MNEKRGGEHGGSIVIYFRTGGSKAALRYAISTRSIGTTHCVTLLIGYTSLIQRILENDGEWERRGGRERFYGLFPNRYAFSLEYRIKIDVYFTLLRCPPCPALPPPHAPLRTVTPLPPRKPSPPTGTQPQPPPDYGRA